MDRVHPGSLDHRTALKKLTRLEGKEQEAGMVLRKSCKKLTRALGKLAVKAEVDKVLGFQKADVVMQSCDIEKAINHNVKVLNLNR
jgi:hypothetical protein